MKNNNQLRDKLKGHCNEICVTFSNLQSSNSQDDLEEHEDAIKGLLDFVDANYTPRHDTRFQRLSKSVIKHFIR